MNPKDQNPTVSKKGRHVVVTGAGTGIGRAIALRLASEGAILSLLARNEERLEATASAARKDHGAEVLAASCDIRDRDQVNACFAALARKNGPLFALVANSGIGGPNRPGPEDRFDDILLTNVTGTYSCLRAAQKHLGPGPEPRHLVVISSILSRIGVPAYSGYCASKAGLNGLVRALACELAPTNVQVNAVCPGWVDTAMAWDGLDGMAQGLRISREEAHRRAMQTVPLGRMSQPDDVAGLVSWLLSSDARGVTGQGIDINNGAFMA